MLNSCCFCLICNRGPLKSQVQPYNIYHYIQVLWCHLAALCEEKTEIYAIILSLKPRLQLNFSNVYSSLPLVFPFRINYLNYCFHAIYFYSIYVELKQSLANPIPTFEHELFSLTFLCCFIQSCWIQYAACLSFISCRTKDQAAHLISTPPYACHI